VFISRLLSHAPAFASGAFFRAISFAPPWRSIQGILKQKNAQIYGFLFSAGMI
jgi:hypothetical protein